ncbi:unnamed protein product, partial [Candidula unifasciata]
KMTILIFMTSVYILPGVVLASLPLSATTLSTTLGRVTGVRKVIGANRKIDVFYNIPFAKPPVGGLRFKPPQSAEPWKGERDGTQKPNSCWQSVDTNFGRFPGVEIEDCLYINIWRPVCTQHCSQQKQKSILVWIFGGGFYSGTTTLDLYDASQLAALNDVIVVSIAYRLGPLGFLYLGNDDAPGNAGLLDQALGLKWVRDNAINLGGSPESITIFGESAGAASVGFHLLSPVSRNYFHNAIMQSASPFADWAVLERDVAKNRTLTLISRALCSKNNISSSINCLRSLDPQTLCDKQWILNAGVSFPFAPVIDGYFIPDHPLKMVEKGDVKNANILLGVNKNEGIYFNVYQFQQDFPLKGDGHISNEQFDRILPFYLKNDKKASDLIKEEYMKDSNSSYTQLLDAITGDKSFKCPVLNFASSLTRNGNNHVYTYSFEHRVSTNPWPAWSGVVHGYEIELIFGLPLAMSSVYTEEEKSLSLQMMKLWTNFAKTGYALFVYK